MELERYLVIKKLVIEAGYGEEIAWSEGLQPPTDALQFFAEYMWIILSAGMKNQVARLISHRIWKAIEDGESVASVFRHKSKAAAIQRAWDDRDEIFQGYCDADDKLTYLRALPWVGKITYLHLAKNVGFDVAKPDRHLVRMAGEFGMTPSALCEKLSRESGDRVATTDLVLWRAANLRIL